jgi:hypothetical protein
VILLLLACARPTVDPLPEHYHLEMEAAARALVPDPARGGPLQEGAAPLPPFTGVDRAVARYVGVEACAACHPAARAAWEQSGHRHALDALREKSAAFNPACLRCHVTGFGHPSGWAGAATPGLTDVQCEACHGPGSQHVAAPGPGYGTLPESGAACVACHTWENSPDYRWDAYWPKITHGQG